MQKSKIKSDLREKKLNFISNKFIVKKTETI